MVNYIIYGKIIIDEIHASDGRIVPGIIGGGGPQGAFGARLWDDSVGLLTRSGSDLNQEQLDALMGLDIDLSGWVKYPDIPTPYCGMTYDEKGERSSFVLAPERARGSENWVELMSQPLSTPPLYQNPAVIHLISERFAEPMIETALGLQKKGAIFSLEPVIHSLAWEKRDEYLELFKRVDVITPDWKFASSLAGSRDPKHVLSFWSKLGPSLVAIRHGQNGSYTWDRRHDQYWHIPAIKTTVVDPTGAGNSYGGGLCTGWHLDGDARLAGCHGAVSAFFLVRQYGWPKMSAGLRSEAQTILQLALASTNVL